MTIIQTVSSHISKDMANIGIEPTMKAQTIIQNLSVANVSEPIYSSPGL